MTNSKLSPVKVTTALLSLLITGTSMAADYRTSDGIAPGDSNSKWLLGATAGGYENLVVGEESDNEGFLNINLEYRGEKFFVAKDEIGYNLWRDNGFSAGVALSGKDTFLYDKEAYDDNQVIAHLEERDPTLDLGFYLIHNSDLGQLRFRVLEEFTGEHDGRSVDASYTFDLNYSGFRINPYVAASYLTDGSVDYFFGVNEDEATAELAAYEGEAALNLTAGINARYDLSRHWELGFGASVTKLGDGIADSSLVKDDTMVITGLTVNYNF